MNKKLLAAAVAAAVVASPAAFAESTVYGKMHASIDAQDYESTSADNYEVNSRASRLGFKGSEDLGNGLKAIYQIELGIDINSSGEDGQGASSSSPWGTSTRNTFVGLSGDWGTFFVGRHDTPAKTAFYAAGNDRLGDSVIDLNLRNNLKGEPDRRFYPIGVFHEYRADDAIAYVSPNFSGFTVIAAVMPGEDGKKTSLQTIGNARDGLADHYSFGAMYKGNGLKASVGYASYDLDPATSVPYDLGTEGADYEVLQAGATYTMNNFSFGGQYEDASNMPPGFLPSSVTTAFNIGNKGHDYRAWALTGKATFGNNAISAVYTDAKFEPKVNISGDFDVDRSGWGVAAEHNFSKRTKVYAAYAAGEDEYGRALKDGGQKDEDNDVFSLGMIHNF